MTYNIPLWFPILFSAALGAVLGSFFNVCIYRIPRGISVVHPPSACPSCKKPVARYDKIMHPEILWCRTS